MNMQERCGTRERRGDEVKGMGRVLSHMPSKLSIK